MSMTSEEARDQVIQVIQEGVAAGVMMTIRNAHQHRFDSIAVEFVDGTLVILRVSDILESQ